MDRTRMMVCVAMAVAVMLVLGTAQARADDFEVKIQITQPGGPGEKWRIETLPPKGPDLCRLSVDLPICKESGKTYTQIKWVLIGSYSPTGQERVVIRQADVAAYDCFQQTEWTITEQQLTANSGPVVCDIPDAVSKYGVLWPYDVQLWLEGDADKPTSETDPRGIMH